MTVSHDQPSASPTPAGAPRTLAAFAATRGPSGEAFEIAAATLAPGEIEERRAFRASAPHPAAVPGREPPCTHPDPRAMRDAFWEWLCALAAGGALLFSRGDADIVRACVADDPRRALGGVPVVHEVETMLLAIGSAGLWQEIADEWCDIFTRRELAASDPPSAAARAAATAHVAAAALDLAGCLVEVFNLPRAEPEGDPS